MSMFKSKGQATMFFIMLAAVVLVMTLGITKIFVDRNLAQTRNQVDVYLQVGDKGKEISALFASKVSERSFMEVAGDLFAANSESILNNDLSILELSLSRADPKYYFSVYTGKAALSAADSAAFDLIIMQASAEYGVDPSLIKAVIAKESSFNPKAVSVTGAAGLMQIVPSTARELGLYVPEYTTEKRSVEMPGEGLVSRTVPVCNAFHKDEIEKFCSLNTDERFDPTKNIMAGAKYLSQLIAKNNGDTSKALLDYSGQSYSLADISQFYNKYAQVNIVRQFPAGGSPLGLTLDAEVPVPGAQAGNFKGGVRLG